MDISVVINTRNEAGHIKALVTSAKEFASEIIVVDMESEDGTAEIAKAAGAKVFSHIPMGYVEPARNFAISKAKGPWILIIDADERLPSSLISKLQDLSADTEIKHVKLPRKNLIFDQWIQHSGWWPDYNVRFFQKGSVTWMNEIHSQPQLTGKGISLPPEEKFSLEHHHYKSISQYLQRLDRYTNHQLSQLQANKHQFLWTDLITKPMAEFLNRFFAQSGYKDGLHGLALALLQSFSELVLYLKLWEVHKFPPQQLPADELDQTLTKTCKDLLWWLAHKKDQSGTKLRSKITRLKSRLL